MASFSLYGGDTLENDLLIPFIVKYIPWEMDLSNFPW